jgi:hypothetical protein
MKKSIQLWIFSSLVLLSLLSIASLLSFSPVQAQDGGTPTPTPEHPDGPSVTAAPGDLEREAEELATLQADHMSRSVFDYSIAYLIGEDAASNDPVLSEAIIGEMTGAQVFYDYDAFLAVNDQLPFEIVILHPSILDQLDQSWTAEAFRNGVIFMGLDVSIGQLASLFDIPCFWDTEQEIPENLQSVHWMNVLGYEITLEDESQLEGVKQELFTKCTVEGEKFGTSVQAGYHVTTMPTIQPEWINTIPDILTSYTAQYGLPNRRLQIPLPDLSNQGE